MTDRDPTPGVRLLSGGNPQIPKGNAGIDDEQLRDWIGQAAALPAEETF